MQSGQRAGVYLTFTKGPIGNRLYAALLEDRENIDAALKGPVVNWESDGVKHWIGERKSFPGGLLTEHRHEVLTWFAEHVNRFITVFRPRIEKLLKESE